MLETLKRDPASFRDPSGFVAYENDDLYRVILEQGFTDYDHLIDSGLYEQLVSRRWLVPHHEKDLSLAITANLRQPFKVIQPLKLPFISYPYEWSFSQLKAAAILTLKIQLLAIDYGMHLKDAQAYNIQFCEGSPVFIDTLSFEKQPPKMLWMAMGQFYRHFVWPLILMAYVDVRLSRLLQNHIDGLPIDLVSNILGYKKAWKLGVITHVHLNRLSAFFSEKSVNKSKKQGTPSINIKPLLSQLMSFLEALEPEGSTLWENYYQETNYSDAGFQLKKSWIDAQLNNIKPEKVIDLGSNNGTFSMVAAQYAKEVYAVDFDHNAIDALFRRVRREKIKNVMPVVLDLVNPSPSIGWDSKERTEFFSRIGEGFVFALALIHHLHIAFNINFELQSHFFSKIANRLIIEFVPIDDSQVKKLLEQKKSIPDNYSLTHFKQAFESYYTFTDSVTLDHGRILFLLTRKDIT